MTQGVTCGGTFKGKKFLLAAVTLSALILLGGVITVCTGVGYKCYHPENEWSYNICITNRKSLTQIGGIVTGAGAFLLVMSVILACILKDRSPPTMVQQPHATYMLQGTPSVPAVVHPQPGSPYPQANMDHPPQYSVAAVSQMPVPPGQQMTQLPTAAPGYPEQDTPDTTPQKPASPP